MKKEKKNHKKNKQTNNNRLLIPTTKFNLIYFSSALSFYNDKKIIYANLYNLVWVIVQV